MGITYNRRKEKGLCPTCGKVITGGKICPECREKHRLYVEKRIINLSEEEYKKHKEDAKFNQNARIKYLKEQGLCVKCGKVKPKHGYFSCRGCREKHNRRNRKAYRDKKRITMLIM